MTIQAIETRYAGCRFRSRLEARWAVFFDTLGIPWEYEPEGYELPSGRYLPDFWLPSVTMRGAIHPDDRGIWFEVKSDEFGYDPRWRHLVDASGRALAVGRTFSRSGWDLGLEVMWPDGDSATQEHGAGADIEHTFCDCYPGIWTISYAYESHYHAGPHRRTDLATIAARSARFEHGEQG